MSKDTCQCGCHAIDLYADCSSCCFDDHEHNWTGDLTDYASPGYDQYVVCRNCGIRRSVEDY